MATYSSNSVSLDAPIDIVFDRLSDFSQYQERLESLPEEAKAKIGQVRFTADSIIITAAPVGDIIFEVSERVRPNHIALKAANSPVQMELHINLTETSSESTSMTSTIEVYIPAMLRPMVGGKMQEAADKFAELVSGLFNGHN